MRKKIKNNMSYIMFLILCLIFIVSYGYEKEYYNDKKCSINQKNVEDIKVIQDESTVETTSTNEFKKLVLVNKNKKIPEGYIVNLKSLNNKRNSIADFIYDDLSDMLTDGSNKGLSFWVASGYRSSESQQNILDETINENINKGMTYEQACKEATKLVMPAGYSEHETGLALDITSSSYLNLDEKQENTEENKWLRENCYKYGFILRYPKEKEKITGIDYEPWHFRYVGKEAAEYITKNKITLEEYLEKTN